MLSRYLLLEVEVPAGARARTQRIADVTIGYHDLRTASKATRRGGASVTFTDTSADVARARSRDVMVAVAKQVGAERNQVATALRDAGKVDEARAMFEFNAVYLQKSSDKYDDSGLQLDADANVGASQNLNEQEWTRERKKQVELRYKTQTQRAPTRKQKKD
jgi:hypothetical protein